MLLKVYKKDPHSHSSHPKKESSDRVNLQDFAPINVITVCLACISGAKLNFMVDPSLYSKIPKTMKISKLLRQL